MFGNATNPIGSCSKAAHDGHSFKPCHIYLESVVFRGIYLPLFATCILSAVVLGTTLWTVVDSLCRFHPQEPTNSSPLVCDITVMSSLITQSEIGKLTLKVVGSFVNQHSKKFTKIHKELTIASDKSSYRLGTCSVCTVGLWRCLRNHLKLLQHKLCLNQNKH